MLTAEDIDYAVDFLAPDPSGRAWWRIGDPWEFTEFTFHPTGKGAAQMGPGRDTGYASGQYAFGSPNGKSREPRIAVPAPSHPLRIGDNPIYTEEANRNAPYKLQRAAISLMRFASGWDEGYAHDSPATTALHLSYFKPRSISLERLEKEDVPATIEDWSIHQQVHPINILLTRWGFNGVEFTGLAQWAADSGEFGNVKFPPIDKEGRLVGMVPLYGPHSRYMTPAPEVIEEWLVRYGAIGSGLRGLRSK